MTKLLKKVVTGVATSALVFSMFAVSAPTTNAATAGGVYSTPDGTVWFVTKDMQKRPFTSAGAFLSYGFLSWAQVQPADASVTALPTGSFIAPADGKIFCATETKGTDVAGECALITGSKKASFTSAAVFAAQGHTFARAMYGDSSFLEKTGNIDNGAAAHLPGVLINNSGTVQMVVSGGLWGIPSLDVFNSWGYSFADVVPANAADLVKSQIGVIPARMAGELVPTGTTGPVTPGPANCSNLQGNAGDITVESSGTYGNEEVGEGQNDVPVMAFRVEASDDSDVSINSIRVTLEHVGSGSTRLNRYANEVTVWHGGKMVGSASVSSFSENNNVFSRSISLNGSCIKAGQTGELVVAVSANAVIDSNNQNEDWEADVTQIRFTDGDGVTTTNSITAGTLLQTFTFVDFLTASEVELKASLDSNKNETVNDARRIVVSDSSKTNDVPVLAFRLQAKGDSDVKINRIPVSFTATDGGAGTIADLDQMVTTAKLYRGNTLMSTKSLSTANVLTGSVIFNNLNYTMDAGSTQSFEVRVDFARLNTGVNYDEGDTIAASLTVASIDAEDEQGNELTGSELTGAANSGTHEVTLNASSVTIDSISRSANNDNKIGTYTYRVTVVADEADVDLNSGTIDYTVIGPVGTTDTIGIVKVSGSTTGSVNNYTVEDGNTATFDITITLSAITTAGSYTLQLDDIDGIVITEANRVNGPLTLVP